MLIALLSTAIFIAGCVGDNTTSKQNPNSNTVASNIFAPKSAHSEHVDKKKADYDKFKDQLVKENNEKNEPTEVKENHSVHS